MGEWAKWAMGIKEGTFRNEHWVLYVSDESQNSTTETNTTLYVNYLELKKKKNYFGFLGSILIPYKF